MADFDDETKIGAQRIAAIRKYEALATNPEAFKQELKRLSDAYVHPVAPLTSEQEIAARAEYSLARSVGGQPDVMPLTLSEKMTMQRHYGTLSAEALEQQMQYLDDIYSEQRDKRSTAIVGEGGKAEPGYKGEPTMRESNAREEYNIASEALSALQKKNLPPR